MTTGVITFIIALCGLALVTAQGQRAEERVVDLANIPIPLLLSAVYRGVLIVDRI